MARPAHYILYRFGRIIAILIAAPGLTHSDILGEFEDINPRGVKVYIRLQDS